MGYSASAYGTISLRPDMDNASMEKAIDAINQVFMEICEIDRLEGQTDIIVSHSDKFSHDDAMEMLEKLAPDTVDGLIKMDGEDDFRWRYRFSKEYGTWADEALHPMYETYREDEDGNSIYEVPVYAVLYKKCQSAYTEPKYYEQAKDSSTLVCVYSDEKKAQECCRVLNKVLEVEDRLAGMKEAPDSEADWEYDPEKEWGYYEVERTTLAD